MGKYRVLQNDNGLPRTIYEKTQLELSPFSGMWKFIDWLPVNTPLNDFNGGCVSFKSERLSSELGLDNLYIAFNGYWPNRSAELTTCSFKDLESGPTVEMLEERNETRLLTVASAGNTARAFAFACSKVNRPLLLVVPKDALQKLWIPDECNTDKIILIAIDGDYSEAIAASDNICTFDEFIAEGGAKNIARRDGMGTVMLDGTIAMKRIPDHYIQAVGSGTGGISAWEAAVRLINDGRFGAHMPKLTLAQNLPCAPLFNSVYGGKYNDDCPNGMSDSVLFNRRPPFNVSGGVADALRETNGKICGIYNKDADEASKIFRESEGIDIMNAASVAVAALIQECNEGNLKKEDFVLLNITGGGERLYKKERSVKYLHSDIVTKSENIEIDNIYELINEKIGVGL